MRIGIIGTGVMGKSLASYLAFFDNIDSISLLGSIKGKATNEMESLRNL